MKGTSLWEEFKKFACQGNMIDLAVAVVIGGAFGKIVTALVTDIIMPLVQYALGFLHVPDDFSKWKVGNFLVGDLLNNVVDFFIIALVVFIVIVKIVGAMVKKAAAPPPPAGEPSTKECPMCLSMIPFKAKKCAHCTADLA